MSGTAYGAPKACANTVLRATPPPAPPPRQQPRISGVVALVVEMTQPIHAFRPRVGKGLVAHARYEVRPESVRQRRPRDSSLAFPAWWHSSWR